MSRFRHAVKDRDQHIQTLRIACAVLAFFLLFTCAGWMLAPSKLTVHNPPDLRTGSTRPRGSAAPDGLLLCVLHFSAAQCPAEKRRGGLFRQNQCAVAVSDAVLSGFPESGCKETR